MNSDQFVDNGGNTETAPLPVSSDANSVFLKKRSPRTATNEVKNSKRRVSFAGSNEILEITAQNIRLSPIIDDSLVSQNDVDTENTTAKGERCKDRTKKSVFPNNRTELPSDVFVVKGTEYQNLGLIGKGGSSSVFRVLSKGKLFAFKRVDVKGSEDLDSVFDSYVNEIRLLQQLKGSTHIIELIDAEICREELSIAIVLESGEVDLAKVLTQKQRRKKVEHLQDDVPVHNTSVSLFQPKDLSLENEELNPFFCRMIWQEMLEAVHHIHSHRIVHGNKQL